MVSYGSHFRNHVSVGKGVHAKPLLKAQVAIRSVSKDRRGLVTRQKYSAHAREAVGKCGSRTGRTAAVLPAMSEKRRR